MQRDQRGCKEEQKREQEAGQDAICGWLDFTHWQELKGMKSSEAEAELSNPQEDVLPRECYL